MKLENPAVKKMLAAAFKNHAVLRGQKAELLDLAWRLNDGREPTTQSLGMAITVLRQGGVHRLLERKLSEEQAQQFRPVAEDIDALRARTSVSASPVVKLDGRKVPNVFGPKASVSTLAGARVYFGSSTPVYFEDTSGIRSIAGRYALVPIENLLTSNDPTMLFAPTPGYPQELQERDYEGQQIEQEKVRAAAASIRPELIVSTNADALTGPPIIDRRGIVLGGNGRTMALKLAFRQGDHRYSNGMRRAIDQDLTYGLNGAPIEQNHVLVRVLDRVTDPLRISRLLNSSLGAAQTRETEAISLGQRIGVRSLDLVSNKLEGADTINEAIRLAGASLVESLQTDGVITPYNRAQWLRTRGGEVDLVLNRFAIERISDAIIAVAVGNLVVLREASPAQLLLIAAVAPWALILDRFDRKNRTGYSWVSAWRRALPYWIDTQGKSGSEFFSYWFGGSLFGADEDQEAAKRGEFLADFDGLQLYAWAMTQNSARSLAAQAKRTVREIPTQFTQQRSLINQSVEDIVQGEKSPEQLRLAAYMPARAAIEVLGAKTLMLALKTGGSFANWGFDNQEVVRLYKAQLRDWSPQKPEQLDSTAERRRLEESLRDADEAPDLTPWEAPQKPRIERAAKPPRIVKERPAKPIKPAKPIDPWKGFKTSNANKAKFRALGYSTPMDLVVAVNAGKKIPGFGKQRMDALKGTIRDFFEREGVSSTSVSSPSATTVDDVNEDEDLQAIAEQQRREAFLDQNRRSWAQKVWEEDQRETEDQREAATSEPYGLAKVLLDEQDRRERGKITRLELDARRERERVALSPTQLAEREEQQRREALSIDLENAYRERFDKAGIPSGETGKETWEVANQKRDFWVSLLEDRGWVFKFDDDSRPLLRPYATRGELRIWFQPESIKYSWANHLGQHSFGKSHSLYDRGLKQAISIPLRTMVDLAIQWESMVRDGFEIEQYENERREWQEQEQDKARIRAKQAEEKRLLNEQRAIERRSPNAVEFHLTSDDRQSNSAFHRSGSAGYWWLKGPAGFVKLEKTRGDKMFDQTLWLEPGAYVLGVGRNKDAIREPFEVTAEEPKPKPKNERQEERPAYTGPAFSPNKG